MKMKSITKLVLLLALAGTAVATSHAEERAPEVPAELQVGAGYKVSFRAHASGVQIYTAVVSPSDPSKLVWTLAGPEAVLHDADGDIVGIHYAYAGPTRPAWESSSGSLVVAARNVPAITVDPTAVPWLLLDAVYTEGPGFLKATARIQRVNTTGGLPPSTPPMQLGQEVRIPYTAEYVFYRATE